MCYIRWLSYWLIWTQILDRFKLTGTAEKVAVEIYSTIASVSYLRNLGVKCVVRKVRVPGVCACVCVCVSPNEEAVLRRSGLGENFPLSSILPILVAWQCKMFSHVSRTLTWRFYNWGVLVRLLAFLRHGGNFFSGNERVA